MLGHPQCPHPGKLPPSLLPLITGYDTESRMKKTKGDKRRPGRRIRLNFVPLSLASDVSLLPAGVIAPNTRLEADV